MGAWDPAYTRPCSHLSLSPPLPVPLHHQLLQALPAALRMSQKRIYPAGNAACSSPAQSPQLSSPSTPSTKSSRAFASPGLLQAHPAAPTRMWCCRSPAPRGIPASPTCWLPPGPCSTDGFSPSSALLPGHLPSQGSPWAIPLCGDSGAQHYRAGRGQRSPPQLHPHPPKGCGLLRGALGMGSEKGGNLPLQFSACSTSQGTMRDFHSWEHQEVTLPEGTPLGRSRSQEAERAQELHHQLWV